VALLVDLSDLALPYQHLNSLTSSSASPDRLERAFAVKLSKPWMKEIFSLPHKRKFSKIQAHAWATRESIRSSAEGVPENRRVLDCESVNRFTIFPVLSGLISDNAHWMTFSSPR